MLPLHIDTCSLEKELLSSKWHHLQISKQNQGFFRYPASQFSTLSPGVINWKADNKESSKNFFFLEIKFCLLLFFEYFISQHFPVLSFRERIDIDIEMLESACHIETNSINGLNPSRTQVGT